MSSERFPERVIRITAAARDPVPVLVPVENHWPLVFVHINKTAGTTFTQYLRAHYPDERTMAPPWYGDFAQIGIDDPEKQLYWGHFTFQQFQQRRPHARFITFLRDPVERVVSQYRSLHNPANLRDGWEKVLPTHARVAMQFAQQATFEQFVMSEDPFIVGHILDLQTRFLSSHADRDHPDYLASAIRNLESEFLFFGLTERFNESVELFRYQLSSPLSYQPAQHDRNVSQQYQANLRGDVARRVQDLVANDRLLYAFARQEFSRRIAAIQVDGDSTTADAA